MGCVGLLGLTFATVPFTTRTLPAVITSIFGVLTSIMVIAIFRQYDKLLRTQAEHLDLNEKVIEQQAEMISKLMIIRRTPQQK